MSFVQIELPDQPRLLPRHRHHRLNPQNLSAPNIVFLQSMPEKTRAFNYALAGIPELLSERVKIRMSAELYVTYKGDKAYRRLPGLYVTVSAPNAEQALLFVETMQRFAADLEGKWLAPLPEVGESSTAEPSESKP